LARLDGSHTLLARNAGGGRAVAGNTVVCREDFARTLRCHWRELTDVILALDAGAGRTHSVDVAPVLQKQSSGQLLDELVVCTHHEGDRGPYLTSAVLMVNDPADGRINWSINRWQVAGDLTLHGLVQVGNARRVIERHWASGSDAPVVIACGLHPLALLATQLRRPEPFDGLGAYAALCGSTIETIPAPLTGVEVPACAEWLLEARIARDRRGREGPFGEFPRTYGAAHDDGLIVQIDAIWHRDEPISQTILPAGREHLLLGGIAREAALVRQLRTSGFQVSAVRLTEGGACRFHAVVSCPRVEQPATDLIEAVVTTDPLVKHVFVVDDDIDVHDMSEVEWALSTRFRADRDIVVLLDQPGTKLDPASSAGRVAKLGLDARLESDAHPTTRRIAIPGADSLQLADYLDQRL
jgi:2,5-furandicarboxylate decarboxylase 1